MTRRRLDAPDPTSWPAFDDAVLPKELRQIFLARRHAIELYAQGALLREIEAKYRRPSSPALPLARPLHGFAR
jgi:hypothetical protein